MFYSKWKRVALGLAVVAAVATSASQAEAHLFGHHGSSGGSSGGYYYGSSGGSSGGWYGYGSSGGSYGGGHHHHWGSSGGSSGGWYGSSGGSSGGSYAGYGWSGGSSGGSSGGYYSSAASYADSCGCGYEGGSYAAPMMYGTPTPGPAGTPTVPPMPTPPMGTSTQYGVDAAMLLVNVPADAKIYVNGNATSSTGAQRQYISRNLEAGHSYGYEIKAEMVVDGKVVTQTKSVRLVPGQSLNVQFDAANVASQPTPADVKVSTTPAPASNKTTLKLHVPADAKVSLAGVETSSRGEDREFISSKLASGAAWDNYTVRVVLDQNGKSVVKEQTISLVGGETRELSFDFAGASVADVANVSVR